jgi:hypothetical protein
MEGPGAAFGTAVVDVVVLVELVVLAELAVGGVGAPRFGAACAGAAHAAPTKESSTDEARTPMVRARNAWRVFIVKTRLQDATPQGAALLIDTPQLHRQGPPRLRADRSKAGDGSRYLWRPRSIGVSGVLQSTGVPRLGNRNRCDSAVDQNDVNTR